MNEHERRAQPSRSPARMQEYRRQYELDNADKVAASKAAWRGRNKEKIFSYHLRREYDLSLEQYDTMVYGCNQSCEICGEHVKHALEQGGRAEKACVDHCHTTGKVRGVLCHSCNRQLTFVERHRDGILKYLEKHQ